jgi:hypothetical protein
LRRRAREHGACRHPQTRAASVHSPHG